MLLGAHESVAGGLHRAFALAIEDGCEAIQIFTKNSNQWREPDLKREQITAFREARLSSPLRGSPVLAHDSYLINLCATDETLRQRSREALLYESLRCEALEIEYVVLHPGAHLSAGVDAGVDLAVQQLAWVIDRTSGAKVSLLIENTAGQGTSIGSRFEEVGAMVRGVEQITGAEGSKRIGVCFDTCHAFAAGYDMTTPAAYDRLWSEFDEIIGLSRLRAVHINDAKKGLGSRIDRHERLGLGEMGMYPFWRLVNDTALSDIVGVLETPPDGEDRAYAAQLHALHALMKSPSPEPRQRAFALSVQESRKATDKKSTTGSVPKK